MAAKKFVQHAFPLCMIVAAGLVRLPIAADSLSLPGDMPLDAASVIIELWGAEVDVLLDPTARPQLRASNALDDTSSIHFARALSIDGVLKIRRPSDTSNKAAQMSGKAVHLKVDIVIGAEQDVQLVGRDLRITTRESKQPNVTAPRGLQLTLEDSELNMEAGRDAVIFAKQTSIFLSETRGQLDLNLKSGTAEIHQHVGSLKLQSSATEVTLVDFDGKLEPLVTGGSLDLRGGQGQIDGQADDAIVLLDSWHGSLSLTADNTSLEARGTSDANPWKIVGENLLVTLESRKGTVEAEIKGGRFDATSLGDELNLTATNGATVELNNLDGPVILKLFEQANAQLTDLSDSLQAELRDASLQAQGIGPLSVNGDSSEIDLRDIAGKVDLSLNHCDLELDLTGYENRSPSLVLAGKGQARIWLGPPCEVRVIGPVGQSYDRIGVSGCDLRLPGQPIPTGRTLGQESPTILKVTTTPDFDLKVDASG